MTPLESLRILATGLNGDVGWEGEEREGEGEIRGLFLLGLTLTRGDLFFVFGEGREGALGDRRLGCLLPLPRTLCCFALDT